MENRIKRQVEGNEGKGFEDGKEGAGGRDDGQRVLVGEMSRSLGWVQKVVPNASAKQIVRWGMMVWAALLVLIFISIALFKHDIGIDVIDQPSTIVHRYQGRHRVVDGMVVNVNVSREGENDDATKISISPEQ